MEVEIHVSNVLSQIIGRIPPEVHQTLRNELSYVVSGAVFSEYSKQGMWDGTKNLYNVKTQMFPTGLLHKALVALYNCGYKVNIEDKRERPELHPIELQNVELRDYQEEVRDAMIKKTRGVLMAATASGKTIMIASILAKLGVKSLVVVPTAVLLTQTAEVLASKLGCDIGMIGDGIHTTRDITVATYQSLTDSEDTKKSKYDTTSGKWKKVNKKQVVVREDYVEYLKSVECVIIDETHHMISSSIQQIMAACTNSYYRFGCSATPFNNRDEDVLIEAACGRVVKEITASYLIKHGWLSKPTIHLIPFKQQRGGEATNYSGLYEEKITQNPVRNDLLRRIIEYRADKGDSVLVSVRYLEHGKTLYNLLVDKYGKDVVFVNSTVATKKLNEALEKLENKEIKICIGTSLINEGVNLPALNTLVMAGTPKSKIATMQLVGRVLRKTKDKSTVDVYDIQDFNCKYFTSASRERFDIYCSEPEFVKMEDHMFDGEIK